MFIYIIIKFFAKNRINHIGFNYFTLQFFSSQNFKFRHLSKKKKINTKLTFGITTFGLNGSSISKFSNFFNQLIQNISHEQHLFLK